ncbi:hypothetical protein JMF89_13260 [Clostridiaceae bacterium UIB06]|nr:hypothetical protein [Clostridiaceae bacterium UIB06]
MIRDEFLILLLQIIKTNGKIDSLLNKGLQYSQIVTYLNYAIDNKYAILDNGNVGITDEGLSKLKNLNIKYDRYHQNSWISPLDEYRIEKANKFDIYLPDEVR